MFANWKCYEQFPFNGNVFKPLLYTDKSGKEWIILLQSVSPPYHYLYDIANDDYLEWCHDITPEEPDSSPFYFMLEETNKVSASNSNRKVEIEFKFVIDNKNHKIYSLTALHEGILFVSIDISPISSKNGPADGVLLHKKLITHCNNGAYPDFMNFSYVIGLVSEYDEIHLGIGPKATDHFIFDIKTEKLQSGANPVNANLFSARDLTSVSGIPMDGDEDEVIKFVKGEMVDIRDKYKFGRYIVSTIMDIKYKTEEKEDEKYGNSEDNVVVDGKVVDSIKVHYEGFDPKWDEWIKINKKMICDCNGACHTSRKWHRIAVVNSQSVYDKDNKKIVDKNGDRFKNAHFFYTSFYHRLYGILPNKNIYYKKIYNKHKSQSVVAGYVRPNLNETNKLNNNIFKNINNNQEIIDLVFKYYYVYCDEKWSLDPKNTYVRMPARWGKFGCILLPNDEKEVVIFGGSIANMPNQSDLYKYNIKNCTIDRIVAVKHPAFLNSFQTFSVDILYSKKTKSIHLFTKNGNRGRSHFSKVIEEI